MEFDEFIKKYELRYYRDIPDVDNMGESTKSHKMAIAIPHEKQMNKHVFDILVEQTNIDRILEISSEFDVGLSGGLTVSVKKKSPHKIN